MYKLFLTLRYLRLRFIAYLPMVAVALSVFLLLVSASVMNGFLHKIEIAAKGLYGDIVIEPTSARGVGEYDAFIRDIKANVPEVEEASPFMFTYGMIESDYFDNRQAVQVVGIRLPERVRVSSFGNGLFFQKPPDGSHPTQLAYAWTHTQPAAPFTYDPNKVSFDPNFILLATRMKQVQDDTNALINDMEQRSQETGKALDDSDLKLLGDLRTATNIQENSIRRLLVASDAQGRMATLQRQIDRPGKRTEAQVDQLREQLNELSEVTGITPPDRRAIMGLGVPGFSFRTTEGKTIRVIGPGQKVAVTIVPLGMESITGQELVPQREEFTIVDDCRTDVAPIDSNVVYLPFETLQRLNNMGPQVADDDPNKIVVPARCSQIHVKVRDEAGIAALESKDGVKRPRGQALESLVARKIEGRWVKFAKDHPQAAPGMNMRVQTWRERQAQIVNQIAAQRTLVVIMFSISGLVCAVLVFAIFYMIVYQKTKDIGVIKAVGGSSGGVAGIFLSYGAAVGLVGAAIGIVGGYVFVRNINPVHDWVGQTFGLVIWSRDWFMFDNIPNEVEPTTVFWIALYAVAAGLIGAIVPSVLAAWKQPVEALRYE